MNLYLLKRRKVVEFKGRFLKHQIIMERKHLRRIRFKKIGDTIISTVFLGYGLDKNQLFETMVFNKDESTECYRVGTYKEALKIHKHVVNKIKLGV